MKVIKKINNNFAICLDNNGNELIANGKGIGFPKIPYELSDLSKLTRTFYGIDDMYLTLVNEIPETIIEAASIIVDEAKLLIDNSLNPNIVFTLSDHIHFAIKRFTENMDIQIPFSHEVKHLYEKEMEIGNRAIRIIKKMLHVSLPKTEASSIALHFINAENIKSVTCNKTDENTIIHQITTIVEEEFGILINKEGFNYSRFTSHLLYLLKRGKKEDKISSDNHLLFEMMVDQFKKAYTCALQIKKHLLRNLQWDIGEEEMIYMIMHINRLCVREDCNQ